MRVMIGMLMMMWLVMVGGGLAEGVQWLEFERNVVVVAATRIAVVDGFVGDGGCG